MISTKKRISCMRRRNERIEGVRSDDRELGYALDDLCRKHAEVGFASMDELRRSLKDIARGADKLGCGFAVQMTDNGRRYRMQGVDEFFDEIDRYLDDDTFLELTFMDGEPGNNYMLTFNDYDGNMEECAELVFIPRDDDDDDVEEKCSRKHKNEEYDEDEDDVSLEDIIMDSCDDASDGKFDHLAIRKPTA